MAVTIFLTELSKMSVAGDKEKNIDGLIDFFQILWDRGMSDCLDIFYQYAKPLVYIDNMYIRRLLLTGIFKELDVTSEEFVKERLKKSQTMQYFTISETLHNGKNTLIMSGCFQSSQVVAKCYKFQREQLIMKYSFRRRKAANFANEAFMLSYLRKRECHSNIVQLIAYDEQLSCMVLKRVSQGCLLKFLRNRRTMYLSPKLMDLLHMIIQIADALVFLKKEKVFHLGIRAENVLLDENYHVKLTGFQSSRKSEEPVNLVEVENHHMKWMDPEGLSGKPVSHATDIWSFGVLMYEILTYGCVPYNNPTGNPDYDDFERKPMTSSQARLFVSETSIAI